MLRPPVGPVSLPCDTSVRMKTIRSPFLPEIFAQSSGLVVLGRSSCSRNSCLIESSRSWVPIPRVPPAIERMYADSDENRFLEVTYASGDKEILFFKDFNSGAMIENIVARAKKMAIKEHLETGTAGLRVGHLMTACLDEFKENEDLPNTTNPDDWAKIAGKKGERIVYVKPLMGETKEKQRAVERVINTGQYL